MSNNLLKKQELGQFFTVKENWLLPHILDFIKNSKCKIAYDPFAGAGNLLNAVKPFGITKTIGLDIDKNLKWKLNDSLLNIPRIENSILLTNPPYLAKQSASRKHLNLNYFKNSSYDDLYLIALDKMLEASKFVVAIIPESFINSNYKQKNLLSSITILEQNPFLDTENPVCIACFDGEYKELSKVKVYKENKFINDLDSILKIRLEPKFNVDISFNDLNGWLGLRAIDKSDDKTFIKFDFKENINYDWDNNIKVSSRHISLINIDIPKNKRNLLIKKSNEILQEIRGLSADVLLTPFKGNTKKGKRRRRMDFRLARAILEKAKEKILD
ncbi:MAG: hypothetical protein MJ247_06430 [Alphaproteobacteria bacterium]|nr:hypothetical protein [Alphaproteobacteria bacterium]